MNNKELYWYRKWEEAAGKSTFTNIYPKVEICWDNSAATYDLGMGKSMDRVEIVMEELEKLGFYKGSLKNILDIGSGTGTYTIPLAGLAESVTALDCSEKMNACLKKKMHAMNIKNVRTLTADFLQYEFNNSFDLVLGSMNPALYNPFAFEKMLGLANKLLVYVGVIQSLLSSSSDKRTLEEMLFHVKLTHGKSNDIKFPYELLKAKGFKPYIREVDCKWDYKERMEQAFSELKEMYKQLNPCEENWEELLKSYIEQISEDNYIVRKGNYRLGVLFCVLEKT
ncbi:MAG: class I SAM-dependent methyltransferase [Blautia sp.]|nr:class I SAM-dependent methyltransferase [Blautia sp.]MDY3998864.1 class I SAM-dependent methyltransferase [Blautia sp.]